MSRAGQVAAVALLAGLAVLAAWSPVTLDDHWWHMLTGRYVLEQGAVPTTDPFSFTMAGEPWVNWEWLAGVVMVVAFDALEAPGMVLLRIVAVFSTLVMLWVHFQHVDADREGEASDLTLRLLLLVGCLLVILGRLADRPHLYALPLLAAVHLLAAYTARRASLESLLGEIACMVPWVLLHPSWPLGLAVHAAEQLGRRREQRDGNGRGSWVRGLAPLLLLLPALLLLPLADYVAAVTGLFRASSSLREWQPLWAYLHYTNVPLLVFLALAATFLGVLAVDAPARRRPTTWLVALLLVGSLWFVRFTPLFAVVAAPLLYRVLAPRLAARELPARTAYLATTLVGLSSLLLLLATRSVFGQPFEAEVDPRSNPVAVGDLLEARRWGGNVLASELNAHAYLALRRYPEVREYIDGRIPQLFPEAALLDYAALWRSPARMNALLDEGEVDHVVLQPLFGERSGFACQVLVRREDFAVVHVDDHSLLWTRASEGSAPVYRHVIPPLIDDAWFSAALAPDLFPEVVAELDRFRAAQPTSRVQHTLRETLASHPLASAAQRAALGVPPKNVAQ